jgi:hypothetical protein
LISLVRWSTTASEILRMEIRLKARSPLID